MGTKEWGSAFCLVVSQDSISTLLTSCCCSLQQYWVSSEPYRFMPVTEIAARFREWSTGQRTAEALATPFEKSEAHDNALVTTPYALPGNTNNSNAL